MIRFAFAYCSEPQVLQEITYDKMDLTTKWIKRFLNDTQTNDLEPPGRVKNKGKVDKATKIWSVPLGERRMTPQGHLLA